MTYIEHLPTALYARLSKKNNGYDSDDSIKTQVNLLKNFIDGNDELDLKDTFIDNGYSGTSFERPGFKRMMDEVKRGEIRCIVVKDLSRFGRDYLETGYYIENILPLLGTRLIAVTDNFDSARGSDRESITVPIRNIFNAMYAREVSKKQAAVRSMKLSRGMIDITVPPYGYLSNKGIVTIDPDTAVYVRFIFLWTLIGVPRSEIAKRLQLLGAVTPMEALHKRGLMLGRASGRWSCHTIKGILQNPFYTGDAVIGKSHRSLCGGIEPHTNKRDEWICIPDHHEALVTNEQYAKIEEMIEKNREQKSKRHKITDAPFRGKVRCGKCGRLMPFDGSVYRCCGTKIRQSCLGMIINDKISEYANECRKAADDAISGKDAKLAEFDEYIKKEFVYAEELKARLCGFSMDEKHRAEREALILKLQKAKREISDTKEKIREFEKSVELLVKKADKQISLFSAREIPPETAAGLLKQVTVYPDGAVKIEVDEGEQI